MIAASASAQLLRVTRSADPRMEANVAPAFDFSRTFSLTIAACSESLFSAHSTGSRRKPPGLPDPFLCIACGAEFCRIGHDRHFSVCISSVVAGDSVSGGFCGAFVETAEPDGAAPMVSSRSWNVSGQVATAPPWMPSP